MGGIEKLFGEDKVSNILKPAMCVGELIAILKEYPQDMPVSVGCELFYPIVVSRSIWTHNNYPYDQPDIEFVCLE